MMNAVVVVLLSLISPTLGFPAQQPKGQYVVPVSGAVTQHFTPPSSYYGPGARGVRYATTLGGPVEAAGSGIVIFVGQVAGDLAVTIEHPDGLLTTVSSLSSITISEGEAVAAGQQVATAGPTTVLTARAGRAYVNPEALFTTRTHAHLVR